MKTLLALLAALILTATLTTPATADSTPPAKHGGGNEWCC